jgi:hypothetical protein
MIFFIHFELFLSLLAFGSQLPVHIAVLLSQGGIADIG